MTLIHMYSYVLLIHASYEYCGRVGGWRIYYSPALPSGGYCRSSNTIMRSGLGEWDATTLPAITLMSTDTNFPTADICPLL